MAKIEKLPSGNYRIRVYNKYLKKTKSFTASSEKEVKAMAFFYEQEMDSYDIKDYTVQTAIESYISNRSATLSPSTIRGYRRMQRNNYDKINHISLDRICSEDIQVFVNSLASYSPKTIRSIVGLLVSSIKAVRPNKAINVSLPQKKPIERHIPTDKDIKSLLDQSSGNLHKGILLASIGTLRAGEVCAVKYEDLQSNVLHIHADFVQDENNKWVYKDIPKNASSDRFVEFPAEVIAEIGSGEGFIVPINPNTLTKEFIKLRNKLGLQCRFHDLRHYAASIMHAIGIPDQYIQKMGGWSSPAMLHEVYRNTLSDKEKEFSNKFNDYMSSLF